MILYKLRRKLRKKLERFFLKKRFIKSFHKYDLLIYDDIFPHPISGFRFEEYKILLTEFKNAKIILEPLSYPVVGTSVDRHKTHVLEFKTKFPSTKNKLVNAEGVTNVNTKLFYCIFLNNIYNNLEWIEKYKIPFVFTLYPGGGFQVEDHLSNQKLKRVTASPQFKKVIVTQHYTKEYLINNHFCEKDKIEYVFGCVVPQISFENNIENKNFFPEKKTFDIIFCAAKYMPKGLDKGYDVFIALAHSLRKKYDFVRFHVVGGFNKEEIDVSQLENTITFYGYQKFEDLAAIFKNIDVILSPNKPFFLGKGAFDGFPLGTVVEAGLNGVVAMVTDKLNQNTVFKEDEEIIIINDDLNLIEKKIIDLIENPKKMLDFSQKGKTKFLEIYSNEYQLKPRIKVLKDAIEKQ